MAVNREEILPTEDLISPERLAKGDLEVAKNLHGKISRAIPMNLTIIKELVRRRVFPYHYEIYGVGFLELRNAFRAPWTVRSSAVLLEQWGIGVSNSQADNIYQTVCKKVGNSKINMIQFVMETKEKRNPLNLRKEFDLLDRRKDRIGYWKDDFSLLIEVMDYERDKVFALK